MYTYQALVTKIYDADTITVDIDLGFNVQLHDVKLRLYGTERPDGITARDWLSNNVQYNQPTLT